MDLATLLLLKSLVGDGSGYDDTEVRELIAQRAKNHTFDTYNDMVDWLSDDDNKASLIQGDGLFILAEDTPDYWWNGDNVEPYEANDTVAQSMAEEAIGIAKGRATGYVFDTKDDMDEWLEDEDNVEKLVLGDNFYIRDLDVPDYWWDGTQPQELETQKVDLTDYVKDTDYATANKGGTLKTANNLSLDTEGAVYANTITEQQYQSSANSVFVSKGTLENIKESLSDTKIIKGQGSPTTSTIGVVGLIYEDTTNGELYICTATNPPSFTWVKLIKENDVPSSSKAGVIKINTNYGVTTSSGNLVGVSKTAENYPNADTRTFITKGTLDNIKDTLSDSKIISGTSAPTVGTVGTIGLLYEDTTNGVLYICTNATSTTYTWTKVISPTDYATNANGGTIKTSTSYGTSMTNGFLIGSTKTQSNYKSLSTSAFICKGTLENLTETWTFTDEDGVVTTKKVYVSPV